MQGGGRRRESGGGGSCAGDGGQKQPRSRLVMTAGELSAGDGWGERRALSAQNREMASPGRCCSNHANSGSVQRRSASLPAAWTLGGGRVEDVVATRGKCASWRQESCERDSRACVSCVCVPGSVCVCQEAYCSRRVAWRCGGGILRMQKCVPYCCCVCARACGPKARGARREATDRALSPKVVRNAPQNRSLCRGRCGPSRGGAPYIHARGDPAAWSVRRHESWSAMLGCHSPCRHRCRDKGAQVQGRLCRLSGASVAERRITWRLEVSGTRLASWSGRPVCVSGGGAYRSGERAAPRRWQGSDAGAES